MEKEQAPKSNGMAISSEQMASYKKIFENPKYQRSNLSGENGFDKDSLNYYLHTCTSMSSNLRNKMIKAWEWTEIVSFDQFVKFMHLNYKFEYDGLEYDPDFGKLVRKLDQEQKNLNDRQRAAFYQRRQNELEKVMEKQQRKDHDQEARDLISNTYGNNNSIMIEAMLKSQKEEGLNISSRAQLNKFAEVAKQKAVKKIKEKNDWKYYQECIDEKMLKEWRSFGKTARDWTKVKVITFNEQGLPVAMQVQQYRKIQNEKEKEIKDQGNSHVLVKQSEINKCMKKVYQQLDKHDFKENEEAATDCSICLNFMIESCLLPCRHRFCIQCMRRNMDYQNCCPLCRKKVPDYYRNQYYRAFIDDDFKSVVQKFFKIQYEQEIQNYMIKDIPLADQFKMQFEVGQYYMGYENPETVTDYEQMCTKNEWTFFIRTKKSAFRPFISQFLQFADVRIPGRAKSMEVKAPERSELTGADGADNYQIMTKINRSNFQLDKKTSTVIQIQVTCFLNPKLMSDKARSKPFEFNFPLNFDTKESIETFTISFDQEKVQKNLQIEDFQRALIDKERSSSDESIKSIEEIKN